MRLTLLAAHRLCVAALLLVAWAQPAAGQDGAAPGGSGTSGMAARLDAIANASVYTNPYAGSVRARNLRSVPPPPGTQDLLRYRSEIARFLLYAGQSEEAAETLEDVLARGLAAPGVSPTFVSAVRQLLALSHLRVATQRNCAAGAATGRCSAPMRRAGIHPDERPARRAIELYEGILRDPPDESTALDSQWLLNLAYMTLGEYPFEVPEPWLVPPTAFRSDHDVRTFPDVAPRLGIDLAGRKGGVALDDFDGDGDLDLVASSAGLFAVAAGENPTQLRYFRNNGDGSFTDRTAAAGLTGLVSGLNLVQADYDNDGFLDLLVLRGAWLNAPHPNSLLRNNGDGTFSDVTDEAGLLVSAPTQTAAWGDYDNDGWIDLYVGNETSGATAYPSQLFRNNRDGTFSDVAAESGVDVVGFVKGVVWGDYDNDGRLDLYVTRLDPGQPNRLFHNDGPAAGGGWSFRDVAAEAGVEGPPVSFPTWFFDYDNDGWEDLFVSGFSGGLSDVVLERLGRPHRGQLPRLYRNNRDGTFTDVTRATRLDRIMVGMGSNFGDLDNDGFLDMYLGTGDPDYRMLIPNLMFRNAGGRLFQDVTSSGGFGHLQKGHGVAFGDVDGDGDQDLYHVLGGAFEGDTFPNALYLNPGHGNRWITLRLEGVASNRMGIGARIRIGLETPAGDREVHATAGSGGSFGGSSLQQEIGLGDATAIPEVAVTWPASGRTDVYRDVEPNRIYRVREGARGITPLAREPWTLAVIEATPPQGLGDRAHALDASVIGDWPEAVRRFGRAIALEPDDALLHLQLGMVLNLMGREADAVLAPLRDAVRLDPTLARGHYLIATLLEREGRAGEAIEHFRLAAARDPDRGDATLRLARALHRDGQLEESLPYYERTIARSDARFGQAMALVGLRRFADARDRFSVGMDRHPGEPAFALGLARLLAAAPVDSVRDGQRALDLVQALAAEIRTTAVAETMAMAHAEQGQFAEALRWQRLAMSVATDAGQVGAVRRMSANLALYLRGQPCRTPWHADELQ